MLCSVRRIYFTFNVRPWPLLLLLVSGGACSNAYSEIRKIVCLFIFILE